MLADDDDEMLSLQCAQLPTYPLNKYEKNGKAHGLLLKKLNSARSTNNEFLFSNQCACCYIASSGRME